MIKYQELGTCVLGYARFIQAHANSVMLLKDPIESVLHSP
jgi:hypothetical protein